MIEALKPGLVIGKGGETSKRIILETGWTPNIIRAPTQKSEILSGLRHHLNKYADERKKIMIETAKDIYREVTLSPNDWVRITALGGFREVGRSCILAETNHTRVLMECGVNVSMHNEPYPYLEALHFPLNELNAVIISHAHMDHSGFLPFLFKSGYDGPVYCTAPTRDLMTLLHFDFIDVLTKEGKEPPYNERDVKEGVKHCIIRDYREVTDIAPDMRLTFHNAAHILGSSSVHLHIGEGGHNLVYSLDYNTPITVLDMDNNVIIEKIGKIADSQIEKYGIGKGFVEDAVNIERLKTIVFNQKTLKSEIVEITSFIRHPINEDLYEIKTKTGRSTIVTGSHSVFTVKNGNVISVMAKDLSLGDYLVGLKQIKLDGQTPRVFLPAERFAVKFEGRKLEERLNQIKQKVEKYFPVKKEKVSLWAKERLENGSYNEQISRKYKVSEKTVRNAFEKIGIPAQPRVKTIIPAEFNINEDFARFLGYYVSEGCTNKNTVIISQKDHEILQDSINIIKTFFGIEGKIVRNEAQFYSKQLKNMLKEVLKCGENAYEKRVPQQLLLANEKIVSDFLKGYFIGDGSIRKRKNNKGISISCASKNPDLIQDVAFILLRLGITPTFEYNQTTKMYNLHVYGRKLMKKFLETAPIQKWKMVLSSQEERKTKSNFAERIPIKILSQNIVEKINKSPWQSAKTCGTITLQKFGLDENEKKLLESDLIFDEIKGVRKVKSTSKYVYDLQVQGYENFAGGQGFLFMHNSADIKFGFTRLFNNVDIKYPRLETLILESTYGGQDDIMPLREEAEDRLLRVIKETMQIDGNVLIPVFSVGRGQEMMLVLENFYRKGLLDAKCYVDGMTNEASAIHTAYPEYMREGIQRRILQNDSPFTAEIFANAREKSKEEVLTEGSSIIIASSGMLTGGPSLEYFYRMAENPNNSIIFVGFQGEGSLGRKIQAGLKSLPVTDKNGKTRALNINMRVETVEGYSGHSDRNQLVNYVRSLKPKPKRILTNHGDLNTTVEFAKYLSAKFKINSTAPRDLDAIRLK